MSRCCKCGTDLAYSKQRMCFECRKEWSSKRKSAFDRALDEFGPLTKNNLRAIQKRVKELEGRGRDETLAWF